MIGFEELKQHFYQIWIKQFPIELVSIELDDVLIQGDGGGDGEGQLGPGLGHAPGLRHRHDVAPRVQRVSIST